MVISAMLSIMGKHEQLVSVNESHAFYTWPFVGIDDMVILSEWQNNSKLRHTCNAVL